MKATDIFGNRFYSGCPHWRQPVRVGRFTVTCSAAPFGRKDLKAPHPDFGVYLASRWKESVGGAILTNGSALKKARELSVYPAIYVDWADMAAPEPQLLTRLVEICLAKMRAGKRVDIGCMQAHGRTGTLLACLVARVEHLGGYTAIDAVRERYCRYACETQAQEHAVVQYAYDVARKRRRDA